MMPANGTQERGSNVPYIPVMAQVSGLTRFESALQRILNQYRQEFISKALKQYDVPQPPNILRGMIEPWEHYLPPVGLNDEQIPVLVSSVKAEAQEFTDDEMQFLRQQTTVPKELHDTPFFKEHICPLTQLPIRHPVRNSQDPEIVFEEDAIEDLLRKTGRYDLINHFERCTELQAEIDQQLVDHFRKQENALYE